MSFPRGLVGWIAPWPLFRADSLVTRPVRPIYLDYNATTPVAPAVQEAMLPFLAEHYGNPSSGYALGRASHESIAVARQRVADLLGCDRDEIVFTAGGTEANNLAIKGAAFARFAQRGHIVISGLEHPAVVEPVRFLERCGYTASVVGASPAGLVDPADVTRALRPDTFLVSIMHANNEIGAIQPLAEISRACRERGVLLHTDAAQSVGKIETRVADLGVDLLSFAGHKLYAPKGIGALYVRRGLTLEPLLHGAGQEAGLRAGTENVAYIVGLGRAATLVGNNVAEASVRLAWLRDRLQERLRDGIGDDFSVNAEAAPRLPNTLSANFPGVAGADLLKRCPEICASTGAACHSGSSRLSATLACIGLAPEKARGTLRLSVGFYTEEDDVDRAASLLLAAWEGLK